VSDTRTPALAEVLRAAIENALFDVHTALPGRVEKYDAAKQKMDVKPLLKRIIVLDGGNEITEEIPVIRDVPVIFPRAGGFFISFPIQAGDHVLLIFNERSIDKFVSNGGDDPDLRMHDISDAVAIPGFYPFNKAIGAIDEDDMQIGHDGGVAIIHIKENGIHVGAKDARDKVPLDSRLQDELNRIKDEIQALTDTFNDHTHPLPQFIAPLIPSSMAPCIPGSGIPAPPSEKPPIPASAPSNPGETASELLFLDK
jgi:hypothetical protein